VPQAGAARRGGLLCYGTLAGGFFSERWLGPEPALPGQTPRPGAQVLVNRSLIKYRLVIDDFGGWDAFQALLQALRTIGQRHGTGIATVATRWVLDQPGVAAAIVGRALRRPPGADAGRCSACSSTRQDHALLALPLAAHPGPRGDTYALERDKRRPARPDHGVPDLNRS
jgi:hypothetical protein